MNAPAKNPAEHRPSAWPAHLNDGARWLIGVLLMVFARLAALVFALRWRQHGVGQARLRRRYGVQPDTPISTYDDLSKRIEARRIALGGFVATTSGSTSRAKKITYTRRRLALTHLVFSDTFLRLFLHLGPRRKSFFAFAPFSTDASLTALMLRPAAPPPRLACLQTAHRVQATAPVRAAAERYGDTAVRLWILALANPGMIYATNPSTFAKFFSDLDERWTESQALVSAFVRGDCDSLRVAARAIDAVGAWGRLVRIANAERCPPLPEIFPGLETYACWDGGYVDTFLAQVRRALPEARHIPMYSMSTETIETVGAFADGIAFLPLAPGVLYEFLPEAVDDRPEFLLPATALKAGDTYSLVVSDNYGLLRYQTEDLFRCERLVRGLPDLRFLRRRHLSYSFTGEKLTGEQLSLAFSLARQAEPRLTDVFLSCLPAHPDDEQIPHYKIILVHAGTSTPAVDGDRLCASLDAALAEINAEYASKVKSQRLGRLRFAVMPLLDFVKKLGGEAALANWQAQFKFLPLYPKRWESL